MRNFTEIKQKFDSLKTSIEQPKNLRGEVMRFNYMQYLSIAYLIMDILWNFYFVFMEKLSII